MLPHVVPVFVSSTWRDLMPEREAVRDAVLRLRETQFVGMEYFGSRDKTTRAASLDEVDRSRVYVGIFAARYGSGITEAEYRRARSRGLHCLIYFKDDAAVPDDGDARETDPAQSARLASLKAELEREHGVSTFDSPDDLAARVTADLHNWLFREYLTPILEGAARGEVPPAVAQAVLSGVKDKSGLDPSLLLQLTARHQLRAPVGDFVGRGKEVEELLSALRGGASAAITGISGMGGIGKTELAFYVAERLRDTYPDAQLVVDMRGTDDPPRDPADALASCIRAFHGLEQHLPDDREQLKNIYRSTLEGKRALVLLDNASDGAQVSPLLPPAGSALLITSRNAIALPGMQRTTLEQLEPSEARKLLTGIAPRVPDDVADQICQLCGYLPLAIRAAGSLLDVTADLPPETYAAQLGDERRRLELIGDEGVDINVEASFNLSYARLSADAARVFRQLAVFPASFDAAAEEAVCEDENHKHLSDLLRRHLVLYNPATRRYRLHDLARLFADSRLSAAEKQAGRKRHAEHYLNVLGECNELYKKGKDAFKPGLTLFDRERLNIEAGQQWTSRHAVGDEAAAQLCNKYPGAGGYVLNLRMSAGERTLWLEAALSAARQLKDRNYEKMNLANLGTAYARSGETRRAIECLERSLDIARELGDRVSEGDALGCLGAAYALSGETSRAVEYHEQYLSIAREIGNRRGEGYALTNLGAAYAELGQPERAVEIDEQALVVLREIGDRYAESQVLDNLGDVYVALGNIRAGVKLYEQYLSISREIGDRLGEVEALYDLGVALAKLGEHAQAIAYVEAALEIYGHLESPDAGFDLPSVAEMSAKLAEWRGKATEGG